MVVLVHVRERQPRRAAEGEERSQREYGEGDHEPDESAGSGRVLELGKHVALDDHGESSEGKHSPEEVGCEGHAVEHSRMLGRRRSGSSHADGSPQRGSSTFRRTAGIAEASNGSGPFAETCGISRVCSAACGRYLWGVPELPEVEITRQRIAPLLVGRRIRELHTTAESYFFLTPPAQLRRELKGRTIEALERYGKYLVARCDSGLQLVIHLGMTGQLFSDQATSVRLLSATARSALAPGDLIRFRPDAHTHLRFLFEGSGPAVDMRDVRKFGKVMLLRDGEVHPRLAKLGIDALRVSGEHLFAASRKRKLAVKLLLLDQQVLAGVGNIYADEALFRARVRPTRRAGRVTRREYDAIALGLTSVLQRAIETGGSSISDFVAPDGSDGHYQDERKVYARSGERCFACGDPIRKILLGQRGTHYCRRCQR